MSYILEALKKAQAERQVGHAPDIHTPAPVHVPPGAVPANRKPLLIGLGAGVLIAGVCAVLVWRGQTPPASKPALLAQANVEDQRSAAVPVASVSAPAPQPVPAPVPQAVKTPAADPVFAPAPAVTKSAPTKSAPAVPPSPPPRASAAPAPNDTVPEAVYLPAPARVAEAAPPVRAPDPIPEESLRTLQQLPEAIQREVPKVAVGGYIYSPNPSDRLLLVDKTLRREGEELAPGLVLERLMPKYAVMNYRGTRYRVAY
jgi:general secretion pathway protein B